MNRVDDRYADGMNILTIHKHIVPLNNEFAAAGDRLELELIENEYDDGVFDNDMDYAEGLFDKERIETFHDLYIQILESLILKQTDILGDQDANELQVNMRFDA